MARTPRKAAEVVALIEAMIYGMEKGEKGTEGAPFPAKDLTIQLTDYRDKRGSELYTKAAYEAAVKEETAALGVLITSAVRNSEYFRRVAADNPELLTSLGLSARKQPKEVEAPGECDDFAIALLGITSVEFIYKKPLRGGRVVFYRIERKVTGEGEDKIWETIGSTMLRKIKISNQQRGISCDYRVIAVNSIGDGHPSNVVTIRF